MNQRILGWALIVAGVLTATVAGATDWSTQDYDLYPGDFDGDGSTDVLYVSKDAAKASGIALSDDSGPNLPFQSWPSNYLGIPWHSNVYNVLVADFSGDGRADVLLQRTTPGDHYLLHADANGKFSGITQTIPNGALGLTWSADQHKLHAGNFDGVGRAELFFQATSASGTNAVVLTDSNGLFTAAATQTWTDASWSSFKWSTKHSNIFEGDFNGDGKTDLLVQAKPTIVMIDYEVPIPVPAHAPNSFGVVHSAGGTTPFGLSGVQQWSRNAHGVDWSPNAANIVVGDFDNIGRADVLLQARNSGRSSFLLSGNTAGAAFGIGSVLAPNVTWSADSFRLVAGNFDGSDGAGTYYQSTSSGGTNYYANTVNGGSVSVTTHNPGAATGVVPTTAVGHTVGAFAVSSGGAATYSIPIVVPPGAAGMQPALSIDYASGGGNGPLGVGWNVSGFSEISRCGKTLVQDGVTDAVQLSTSDRFCLDGNRLRLTGGTYGAAGSTYQTELETFSVVTAYGTAGNGPAYFLVEAKNGLIYEYGNTADSRIESLNASAATTARLWALNKVSDRSGNTMTFTYQEDGSPHGSHRPSTISYTTNSNAGLSAAYKVNFHWESRPAADVVSGYVAGGVVRDIYRLNRIETQYNEPGVGFRLVRKYQLSYNASGSTKRSRVASVQECDRDGYCLAPTIVSWLEGTYGWADTEINGPTLPSNSNGFPADLNGDGRDDLAYLDTAAKTWKVVFANADGTYGSARDTVISHPTVFPQALPMDVNGDGVRDLIISDPNNSNRWAWVRYNGSVFVATTTGVSAVTPGDDFYVADVDGDGREDLVSASDTALYVTLNQSTPAAPSFGATTTAWTLAAGDNFSVNPFSTATEDFNSPISAADFDGDGRTDLMASVVRAVCGESFCTSFYGWRLFKSTGSAFTEIVGTWPTYANRSGKPMLADINYDGLTDVVYPAGASPATTWRYRLGVGTGGLLSAEVNTGYAASFSGDGAIGDCDADGHADLVYSTSGAYYCMRSNGESLSAPVGVAGGSTKVADVNGDGLLDFVRKDSSNVWKVRLHRGVQPDFVSSIMDGFGNTVNVTYAPLTDPAVYTKGSSAVFPDIELQEAMYVVKSYSATDGIGGSYSVSHSYKQARAHMQGRGFLGFSEVAAVDSRTGIRSVSIARQDYPYIGFVEDVSIYRPSSNTRVSQTTSVPQVLNLSTAPYNERRFPYTSQTVQKSYEVGGAGDTQQISQVTTTTTLDSYANPTTVTTTTLDPVSGLTYTSSTVNTYPTSDSTCWARGFVTLQQVTNTVPVYGAQTRTVEYVKDTGNPSACRVYQQIVEPTGGTDVKVTTAIGYDTFGNPNSQTVTAANIETRTTTTSFGSQGVFPTSITQSVSSTFSQAASKTYDFALGFRRPRRIRTASSSTSTMTASAG